MVSKFLVVTKERHGKVKHRLVFDLKRSGVSAAARATHRVVLPRASDVVTDVLEMLATREQADEVEIAILDFTDAFWHVPLAFVERRYFVGTVGGRYYGFARAAQGSKNGPLAWAAFVSLVVRLAQGLFSPRGDRRR